MKINYKLSEYRLIDTDNGKPINGTVWLTQKEVDRMNYAYALNGVGVKYEMV